MGRPAPYTAQLGLSRPLSRFQPVVDMFAAKGFPSQGAVLLDGEGAVLASFEEMMATRQAEAAAGGSDGAAGRAAGWRGGKARL